MNPMSLLSPKPVFGHDHSNDFPYGDECLPRSGCSNRCAHPPGRARRRTRHRAAPRRSTPCRWRHRGTMRAPRRSPCRSGPQSSNNDGRVGTPFVACHFTAWREGNPCTGLHCQKFFVVPAGEVEQPIPHHRPRRAVHAAVGDAPSSSPVFGSYAIVHSAEGQTRCLRPLISNSAGVA